MESTDGKQTKHKRPRDESSSRAQWPNRTGRKTTDTLVDGRRRSSRSSRRISRIAIGDMYFDASDYVATFGDRVLTITPDRLLTCDSDTGEYNTSSDMFQLIFSDFPAMISSVQYHHGATKIHQQLDLKPNFTHGAKGQTGCITMELLQGLANKEEIMKHVQSLGLPVHILSDAEYSTIAEAVFFPSHSLWAAATRKEAVFDSLNSEIKKLQDDGCTRETRVQQLGKELAATRTLCKEIVASKDEELFKLRANMEMLRNKQEEENQELWKRVAKMSGEDQFRKEASSLRQQLAKQTEKTSTLQEKMRVLRQDMVEMKKQETKLGQDSTRLSVENTELYEETVTLREALDRHDVDSGSIEQVDEA